MPTKTPSAKSKVLVQPPLKVVDLHTHTFHSDGDLGPAELARRAAYNQYLFLGLCDHCDQSNLSHSLDFSIRAAEKLSGIVGLTLLAGVEITHVPPSQIFGLVDLARQAGADFVAVHGESPVEPVASGTNLAAIEAKVDFLAHPGIITEKEVKLAAKLGVRLELSARGGHCLGNGLVAKLALEYGAPLLIGSDTHDPEDLLTPALAMKVAMGAGLSYEEYLKLVDNATNLATVIAGKSGRRLWEDA
ncbi:MAG: histidinol phosphate phosphatase domain-containing protein [Deltaproteobacteria bacterium]|jgi:histidinol phosphatase-like PHP family hydrolase|nr:histidinol phosphate phosphatase domain-containing protein [Deltaproteobacteria bacterium]